MEVRIMSSKSGYFNMVLFFFSKKGNGIQILKYIYFFQTQNFKDWYILHEYHYYYIISTVCIYKGQNICL